MGPGLSYFIELRNVCRFFSAYFPFIALVTLLFVTIIMALLEKRKRKLILIESESDRRIDELLDNNVVDESEAEKLRQAANALPEVTEEYPLPDIHLRLTSALAKTFSILKLLLIFSSIVVMCFIYQTAKNAPAQANVKYSLESKNLPVFVIVMSLILILSIVQFIASTRITRGGLLSRRIISFVWLFDLAFLFSVMIGSNRSIYSVVAVSACLYTLWTLYLRRDAGEHIAFGAGGISGKYKAALVSVIILALCSGLFLIKSEFSFKFNNSSTATSCQSSFCTSRSNNYSNIKRIAVVVAKPGDDSIAMAKGLFNSLKKQLPELNIFLIPYGKTAPDGAVGYDLYLFVGETEVIKQSMPQPTFSGIPVKIREDINKKTGMLFSQQLPIDDNSISFEVYVSGRFGDNYCFGNGSYLRLPSTANISGSVLVSSDLSGCSREKAIKESVKQAALKLVEILKKEEAFASVDLPEFLLPIHKKVDLNRISFLKNSWCLGAFRNFNYDNFTIYLFPLQKDLKKQRKMIKTEMEKNGWTYQDRYNYNGEMVFKRTGEKYGGPGVRVIIPKPEVKKKNSFSLTPKAKRSFGVLACFSSNRMKYSLNDADKFAEKDFNSYVQCAVLHKLPKDKAMRMLDRVNNDPVASFEVMEALYRESDIKKWLKELQGERERLLVKMGLSLKGGEKEPGFTRKLVSFIQNVNKDRNYTLLEHPALAPLKSSISTVTMTDQKDKPGIFLKENIIAAGADSPVIILAETDKVKGPKVIFIIRVVNLPNGENEISGKLLDLPDADGASIGDMGSNRRQSGDIKGGYMCISGSGGSTGGTMFSNGKIMVKPGQFAVQYDYLAKTDRIIVSIAYNGNAPKGK